MPVGCLIPEPSRHRFRNAPEPAASSNPWTINPKLGDKAPASGNPESPSSSSGPSTPVTDATIPTTTTLMALQTVTYPEQVQLEAVVSPAPQPDQGPRPQSRLRSTANSGVRRRSTRQPAMRSSSRRCRIGTYQFGAQFGPWGNLEASASAPATVDVVEVPGLASSLPSTRVQSSHGFAGLAVTTTSSSPGPEPGIAVGPGHIVQATTAGFQFSNRSGQPMFDVPLPDFFLEDYATSSDASQPRILYDDLHDRWLAVEVARGSVGHLNIAISTTSDPTDVWWVYDFTFAPGRFPDNPSIGVSSNKIAIGLDEWTSAPGFLGSSLLVISSASVLDGDETITYDTTDPNPNQVSWRPAVGQSTGNTLHAVASTPGFGSGHLLHMTVTGTVAGGLTFTVEDLTAGLLTLPGPGEAVLAQAATSETGDAVGWYLPLGPIAAVWQGGSLWFVSDRSCLPEGASSAQACVRVTELSTGTTTGLVQDFVVNSEERSTFDPGLGVTGAGNLILTFTRSGPFTGMLPASPVTILAAVQKASDPPNSLHVPAVIDRASSFSAPSYWSSATGVARDPLDPAAIWQGGAVTKAGGWRTWISRLAAATAGPGGSLVLNGGRGHANALRILAGGSLAAADGATRMRLSGSSATTNGKLTKAAEFPIGDEIAWSLANPATGGTTATGLRHVYVQWGDGAGGWSAVEDARVTVDTPLGASFVPLNPARLLDTRTGIGLSGKFAALAPRSFQVAGRGGVPAGAVAVTGNLTVTGPSRSGYVFLGPTATSSPTSSTLNFPLGETRANGVTVKLSGTGKLGAVYVAPAGASTHLIFDVTGYFVVADPNTPTGTTWRPIEPLRVLDTRVGTGLLGRIHNSSPVVFFVTGFGIPATATAVTGNVTVTGQTSAGYVFVGPSASANPTSSTINVPLKDTRANNATVRLGPGGTLAAVWKGAPGSSTHLLFDVTGYFVAGPAGATYIPLPPARLLDSRFGTGLVGPFVNGVPRTLTVAGVGGIPAADTIGLTGNLTATQSSVAGYVFVGPTPVAHPTSSTINFPQGDNRANGLAVAIANGTSVSAVFTKTSSSVALEATDLLLDVTGYFR